MTSRSSKPSDQPARTRLAVGLVRRPHGVRGEVLVELQSEVPGRLAVGRRVLLGGAAAAPFGTDLEIATSRPQGDGQLLSFVGLESREAVDGLRGVSLEVELDTTPPPPQGRFWIHQLIGCSCEDEVLGPLGVVFDVVEDGGGEMLVVKDGSREILVPFVTAMVPEVDVVARTIRTRLPEGFIEACGSAS